LEDIKHFYELNQKYADSKNGERNLENVINSFGIDKHELAHSMVDDGDEEKKLALKRNPFSQHTEA